MVTAEIIAIGSELLTPFRSDTNSLWLTEKLNDAGIDVVVKTIVGDDVELLAAAIRDGLNRSGLVITTGGLGPTEDDVSRQAAARAVGRELLYSDELESQLRERFRSFGREMPEINKRQAFVIRDAEILPNPNGSAVGLLVEEKGAMLVLLPGPPRENQPMFSDYVLPRLSGLNPGSVICRRVVKVSGLGESAVDEIAAPIYKSFSQVQTSVLINRTEVEIHLAARAESVESASSLAEQAAQQLAEAFGDAVFSTTGESMEEVVVRMLRERGETVAAAESCTGGIVMQRLTDVPGASNCVLEGAVTYSNQAKIRALGVEASIIEKNGAVSAECAEAMADGMKRVSGAVHAVSITGIAGPDGGSDQKPVGTVFVGYSGPQGTISRGFRLPGDRYLVRWRASQAALDLLRRQLLRTS
jgi:nicotinamide-nucleotide amidase